MKRSPLVIDKEKISKYLQIIREIGRYYKPIDVHVHPTDIIFDSYVYVQDDFNEDVLSLSGSRYSEPQVYPIYLNNREDTSIKNNSSNMFNMQLSSFKIRNAYKSIGAKVLSDQMSLSGIGQSLLLPVAPRTGGLEHQFDHLLRYYNNCAQYLLSYSFPNEIEDTQISDTLKTVTKRVVLHAVKIHPNITGIDLNSSLGVDRVEAILNAASAEQLPVIVHGGRSPILKGHPSCCYSEIKKLAKIDWKISMKSIVIAHAGGYGYTVAEFKSEVLPVLKKLLSKHSNLSVDISALHYDVLETVLANINHDRILFGSDFFYVPQWQCIALLAHALTHLIPDIEVPLVKIMSLNARRCILNEP